MRTRILLLIVLIFFVPACAPGSADVQEAADLPSIEPSQPELPTVTPKEWITSQPFQEAPTGQAEMAVSGIPEGYEPQEISYQTANLPTSGYEVGLTQVLYEHPVNGQVMTNDSVTVQVSSHQNLEARVEHLDLFVGSEDSWEYQLVGGQLTARFYSGSGDGRVWISGPYLIAIWSGQDSSAGDPALDPMVDAFTALYLSLYPPD